MGTIKEVVQLGPEEGCQFHDFELEWSFDSYEVPYKR